MDPLSVNFILGGGEEMNGKGNFFFLKNWKEELSFLYIPFPLNQNLKKGLRVEFKH